MKWLVACALAVIGLVAETPARADDLSFRIDQVDSAFTGFSQRGLGYQSKANSVSYADRGSEALEVFQPQVLVLASQGEHIKHQFWFPVDIVTSASANAIDRGRVPDMITQSSRQNESIGLDWTVAYETTKWTASAHNNLHIEENFRSWATGMGATLNLADDNAVVSGGANEVIDWFAGYDGLGVKVGRTTRATSNANAGITQILTPYTVVHANYGISTQNGTLSNTWNTVPVFTGERIAEQLPHNRIRQDFVGRFAQWLPWDGALKGFYRFYLDTWGVTAHALEGQLLQRVHKLVYLRGSYRWYTQTAVNFFTEKILGTDSFYTADSDLAKFVSQTVGGKVVVELPFLFKGAHADAGYERYWRTDGLTVNVALWQAGTRF